MSFRGPIALLLLFAAAAVYAQQYRWVDEKGRVHYSDTPPPPTAKSVRQQTFHGNSVGAQPGYALSRAEREAPVTLYTHPICKAQCQLARELLERRGVPFTEVVATEPEKVEALKRLSGDTAVPVLVVGKQVEKGASAEAYNRALDRAGYPPAGIGGGAPAR